MIRLSILLGGLTCYFFTFEEIPQLLQKVQEERKEKIKRYGIDKYKLIMEREKNKNELFKRIKEIA